MKLYRYRFTYNIHGGSCFGDSYFASTGILAFLERMPVNYPLLDHAILLEDIQDTEKPSKEELDTMFPVLIYKRFTWETLSEPLKLPKDVEFVYDDKEMSSLKNQDKNEAVVYILYSIGKRPKYYCGSNEFWSKVSLLAITKFKPTNPYLEFDPRKALKVDLTMYKDYYPVLISIKVDKYGNIKYWDSDGLIGLRDQIEVEKDSSDSFCKTVGDFLEEFSHCWLYRWIKTKVFQKNDTTSK